MRYAYTVDNKNPKIIKTLGSENLCFRDFQNLREFLFMVMDSVEPGVSLYIWVWEGRKKKDLASPF